MTIVVVEAVAPAGWQQLYTCLLVAALSAGWATVTWAHLRAGDNRTAAWLPLVLVLATVASASRLLVILSASESARFLPAGLAFITATVAVVGAASGLREFVQPRPGNPDVLDSDQERLHEVRSVLAGLQTATSSLLAYGDDFDVSLRRRLHASVSSELARLHQLIDPSDETADEPVGPTSVRASIQPVLDAATLQGLVVRADFEDALALARPTELAAIAAVLLDNARIHAAGARLEVRLTAADEIVLLEFCDSGPGVATDDLETLFERGWRGADRMQTAGSGLGLYIAREHARRMGGDLSAYRPFGTGLTFVLTLKAPRPTVLPQTQLVPIASKAALTASV